MNVKRVEVFTPVFVPAQGIERNGLIRAIVDQRIASREFQQSTLEPGVVHDVTPTYDISKKSPTTFKGRMRAFSHPDRDGGYCEEVVSTPQGQRVTRRVDIPSQGNPPTRKIVIGKSGLGCGMDGKVAEGQYVETVLYLEKPEDESSATPSPRPRRTVLL